MRTLILLLFSVSACWGQFTLRNPFYNAATLKAPAAGGSGATLTKANLTSLDSPSAGSPNAITATTGAFTPSDNSLLVVHCTCMSPGVDVSSGWTMSGGSLTWTRRLGPAAQSGSGFYRMHEIWTAPVSSGASMTVTWNNSGKSWGDVAGYGGIILFVQGYTGYDSSSPIGATASNLIAGAASGSITLTATPASTSIVSASRCFTPNETVAALATPGTGWTEDYDLAVSDDTGGWGGMQLQTRGSSTSTTVGWDDICTDAGGSAFLSTTAMSLEIKQAP